MIRSDIRVERRRHQRIRVPSGPRRVKVGYPKSDVAASIIARAIWNHYGTRRIPPRPFLHLAIRAGQRKYRTILKDAAPGILRGRVPMVVTLHKLGLLAQDDIRNKIRTLRTPPNAPSTIRMKGSSNPLIDTGQMRQSTTYRIED